MTQHLQLCHIHNPEIHLIRFKLLLNQKRKTIKMFVCEQKSPLTGHDSMRSPCIILPTRWQHQQLSQNQWSHDFMAVPKVTWLLLEIGSKQISQKSSPWVAPEFDKTTDCEWSFFSFGWKIQINVLRWSIDDFLYFCKETNLNKEWRFIVQSGRVYPNNFLQYIYLITDQRLILQCFCHFIFCEKLNVPVVCLFKWIKSRF